ncbi:MAG: biotin-dependent carboxyltransferase family protein [Thermodesulfobacteriota bacterium]
MDIFEVVQPGLYTTIQDQGRFGFLQFGIPPCGVVDTYAYKISNMLVGNDLDQAVLEVTVLGPTLHVLGEGVMAVTGAELSPHLNDSRLPLWESIPIKKGDKLGFKGLKKGCRAYVAVGGGIDVPRVMGSRSTYVAGKIGGIEGRSLLAGDIIPKGKTYGTPGKRLPQEFIPSYSSQTTIRVVLGPQDDYFSDGIQTFLNSEFKVSSKADRMGYRLEGPAILQKEGVEKSIISEPSVPGGIQVPPDGQPIILLIEQTVGGYTKIATVISTDIGLVGQAKPGDRIRFKAIDLEAAHRLYVESMEKISKIKNFLTH